MDASKVDLVLKYALAVAAREDEPWARRLGAIHLIKYVYLADLAHAARHGGATFTGADWQFHHYGPWAGDVYERIQPTLAALGAQEFRFESTRYENDTVRWAIPDAEQAEATLAEVDRLLPPGVASAVKKAVHSFGADTTALLHHVYTTPPMTRAAPRERLAFRSEEGPAASQEDEHQPTAKQVKRQKEALRSLQERTKAMLKAKLEKATAPTPAPPYDEVFVAGTQWLDEIAGGDPEPLKGEVQFPDDIWKGPWREPDDS